MIDFVHLVEKFLLEVDATNQSDSSDDLLADVDPLETFIKTNYSEIQTTYKAKYPSNNLTPLSDLKNLIYNASNNSLRNVKGAQAFPTIIDSYPLIDLIAELSTYYKRNARLNPEQQKQISEKILKTFLEKLRNKNTPSVPINFPATTSWAQLVRTSFLGNDKTEMGVMRLDDIPQNSSIFYTIQALLTIRAKNNKSLLKIFKSQDINYAVSKMDKNIQEIFTNPQYFIKGQKAPPADEKMKLLFDDTTSAALVGTSLASFALFENEITNYLGEVDQTIKIKLYQEFIGVNVPQAQSINWAKLKKQNTSPELRSERPGYSAPQSIRNSIISQENFDLKFNNSLQKICEIIFSENEQMELNLNLPDKPKPEPSEPEPEPSQQRPFETTAGSNEFLYSLGNVKKFKDSDPFAGNLYRKLVELADFIKKKEQINWGGVAQGAQQLFTGLSKLGGPDAGR